jgi:hypothetical protein
MGWHCNNIPRWHGMRLHFSRDEGVQGADGRRREVDESSALLTVQRRLGPAAVTSVARTSRWARTARLAALGGCCTAMGGRPAVSIRACPNSAEARPTQRRHPRAESNRDLSVPATQLFGHTIAARAARIRIGGRPRNENRRSNPPPIAPLWATQLLLFSRPAALTHCLVSIFCPTPRRARLTSPSHFLTISPNNPTGSGSFCHSLKLFFDATRYDPTS